MRGMKTIFSRLFFLLIIITFFSGFQHLNSQQSKESTKSQIDVEPSDRQLPYSPADGSIAKVNPPPFIWVPMKENFKYTRDMVKYDDEPEKVWIPVEGKYTFTLQIARDKDFRTNVITQKGIDISTFALEQPLEPGEWYWRYGVEGDEIIYSKARRFIVPSDAKIWYFPGIKKIIDHIPKTHPKDFILKDELESYRYRAKYGDLKDLCSDILKDVEGRIGEELVEEPEFVRGIGPEFGKYSWRVIYDNTIPPVDMTEKIGLAYLLTGDKKYGEEAKRRILHFSSWNPNGSTSDRAHDEPAMRILNRCVRAYDWTYNLFNQEERKKVESVMKIRAAQFYNRLKNKPNREYHSYNFGSHEGRILHFLGEASLCFAHEWEEAEDWLKYVLTLHWNVWPAWGKHDGGWHQGPSYWNGYMNYALHFVVSLKKAIGIDMMQKGFFHNTPYYILYSNPPYAKLSPFGDGENNPPSKSRALTMYHFSSLLYDPYLKWYADFMDAGPGENILGVLLKNDYIKSKPPKDLPQSRYFPGIGLVSLHTNLGNADEDIHFLFHSDPYGKYGHHHPDENAFTIEAFGEALAISSGYYPWYGSKHHVNWQFKTKSSNCITINGGIGQKMVGSSKGKIVAYEEKELYDYILGDAASGYQGLLSKFNRHIIRIRPGVFIMFDDLEAPNPVTFEWWLHALSEMNVNAGKKSITISQGDARLKTLFLQSGKLKFNQFKGFPDPPEMRGENDQFHVTVSTPSKVTNTKFITVLVPFKKDNEPEISIDSLIEKPNEVSLKLGIDGKKYFVSFKPDVTVRKIEN